ncbi:MAG: alkyl sulfatase dimerization domain-containing protein [Clostridiales bacterium]|nr:alkyl sulfatase dimerization domain-containing protein [Clostridiales bacterium]
MCRLCFTKEQKGPSVYTKQVYKDFAKEFQIDMDDAVNEEVKLASEHCILKVEDFEVKNKDGRVVWTLKPFSFYKEKAVADTVHPSLWLNGKANFSAGVFEVVKNGIYQVRGLDSSNITFVRTENGWIVMDPGMSTECASSGLELAEKALQENIRDNVKAVIVSHTHLDHFGGVGGVVDADRIGKVEDGKIPIYVPAGFDIEVVKEHVYAGTAMSKRGGYQGGVGIGDDVKGRVSLGAALTSSSGTISFLTPTDYIEKDCTIVIDGLEVEFQLTPNTEAPVEMNNYFPKYRAFWAAENCCASLHNLYPIRGAQLRDAANWWKYIEIALERYGDKCDVVFQAHNWPHYNSEEHPEGAKEFLRNTAAVYKFIHDETLYYANMGKSALEIAKLVKLPDYLQKVWYTRPYYGSVEINARAVYTKYLGFFTANPTDINPLTELEEAQQFVDYVGSEERVLELAQKDLEEGNYQRAAKAANYVVFVNPSNMQARYLCADAFEQQGYQSESSIWRNAYLTGAHELRHGTSNLQQGFDGSAIISGMTSQMMMDYLGIVTDSRALADVDQKLRLIFTDDNEEFVIHIYHGTILYYEGKTEEKLPVTSLTKQQMLALIGRNFQMVKNQVSSESMELWEQIAAAIQDFSGYSKYPVLEE